MLMRVAWLLVALASFGAAGRAADADPGIEAAATPLIGLGEFLAGAPGWGEARRVRVQGTVTHSISDKTFFIQEGDAAVYVFHKPERALPVGARVEVTGYASLGGYAPTLQRCTVRSLGTGTPPAPAPLTYAEAMTGAGHMRLVRVRGWLAQESLRGGATWVLNAEHRTNTFTAELEALTDLETLQVVEAGSELEVTGVCTLRMSPDRSRPASFSIFVRTPADVVVLHGAPWWTQARVLALLLATLAVLAAALAWAWTLRRQVDRKTRALQAQLEEQTALQERYRESERQRRAIIDAEPECVKVLGADGALLEMNPAGLAMLEAGSLEEAASGPLIAFVRPEYRSAFADLHRRVMAGESGTLEFEIEGRRGTRRWLETHAVPFRGPDGKPESLLGITRDITELRRAEAERRALEQQVQQRERLESLGVLAGGIAHDFNNLLTAVMGNLSLALADLPAGSRAHDPLQEAARASERAADLAGQMLAYSGRGRFKVERVALPAVVQEMAQMLQASISRKAALRMEFGAATPWVEADVTQLRQIVLNLVVNASDALGDQSGSIRITSGGRACDPAFLEKTWLNEPLPGGVYAWFEVSDSGCGIPPERLPSIFDPFFTTKFTGRGLGLAAVLGIIRGHRGALEVVSEVGRGTSFRIYLPAAANQADLPDGPGPAPSQWIRDGLILLVDDEESIRVIGERMLSRLGFQVQVASNGAEAVEAVKTDGARIRAVILDLTMPGMDGAETLREVRRLRPDLRVLLSSGYNEQDLAQRFPEARPAGFLAKPYTLPELEAALRTALEAPAGMDNSAAAESYSRKTA